jgi:hypothetical protein
MTGYCCNFGIRAPPAALAVDAGGPGRNALTEAEVAILDRLAGDAGVPARTTVSRYLEAVAKLGVYPARARDPPPGNMVVWRGLTRLMDIHLGFELSRRIAGN